MTGAVVKILPFLGIVRRYWLSLAVLATLFHLIFLHAASNSLFRRSIAKATNTSEVFARYTKIDNLFNTAAGDANVFLVFSGFDTVDAKTFHWFADPIRFRGVYTMYPRRVCLGPPEILAAAGYDSQKIKFDPDTPWLKANRIASVIVCRFDKDTHSISCDILRVE